MGACREHSSRSVENIGAREQGILGHFSGQFVVVNAWLRATHKSSAEIRHSLPQLDFLFVKSSDTFDQVVVGLLRVSSVVLTQIARRMLT